MSVTVGPDALDSAATTIEALADTIRHGPMVRGDEAASKLSNVRVSTALAATNGISEQVEQVLIDRYREIAGLLRRSAAEYRKTDQRNADRLRRVAAGPGAAGDSSGNSTRGAA